MPWITVTPESVDAIGSPCKKGAKDNSGKTEKPCKKGEIGKPTKSRTIGDTKEVCKKK